MNSKKILNENDLYKFLGVNKNIINFMDYDQISSFYHRFHILKRNGEKRYIDSPNDYLKQIQSKILTNIINNHVLSSAVHGFVKHKSIVSNALVHVNQKEVYNIDIKDFFPSISSLRVQWIFRHLLNFNFEVSKILANLCTFRCRLPQGAPTSPAISNLVSTRLDKRLLLWAKKNQLNYTRYADDITFSGDRIDTFTRKIIRDIITDEGFEVNYNKERLQKFSQRQIVTGLIVNDKLSVQNSTLSELKNAIFFIKKFGLDDHMLRIDSNKSNYKEHLYGLAYYVRMVNKSQGENFLVELDKIIWPY